MTEAVSLLRTSLAGRYELERELGSGGMATVYLARDVKHDRDVAVAATQADEHTPAPSPDGTLIAYVSAETGMPEIYVQPFPSGTGRLRISNGGGGGPRWSRDGRLYYWDRGRLKVVSIQSRPSLAVLSVREIGGSIMPSVTSPYTNLGYDVAPDGRILITEPVPGTFSTVLVRNWLSEIRQ